MKMSLLITAPPGSATAWNALQFARSAIARGHCIHRVFFMGDGAAHANAWAIAPGVHEDHAAAWSQLANDHDLDLVACVNSAARLGIVDEGEAKRRGLSAGNLRDGFVISGLGQLVDATAHSERVVSFGAP